MGWLEDARARRERLDFIDEAERRATRCARKSPWHGPDHWRDVAAMGLMLVERGLERVDLDVVLAFAALHDTKRRNEHTDPYHGPLAALAADRLRRDGFLDWLDDDQFELLGAACHGHTEAPGSMIPTLACCFDADRLTLWRVGKVPREGKLSTAVAAHPDAIGEGYVRVTSADLSWYDIVPEYLVVQKLHGPVDKPLTTW